MSVAKMQLKTKQAFLIFGKLQFSARWRLPFSVNALPNLSGLDCSVERAITLSTG